MIETMRLKRRKESTVARHPAKKEWETTPRPPCQDKKFDFQWFCEYPDLMLTPPRLTLPKWVGTEHCTGRGARSMQLRGELSWQSSPGRCEVMNR